MMARNLVAVHIDSLEKNKMEIIIDSSIMTM